MSEELRVLRQKMLVAKSKAREASIRMQEIAVEHYKLILTSRRFRETCDKLTKLSSSHKTCLTLEDGVLKITRIEV